MPVAVDLHTLADMVELIYYPRRQTCNGPIGDGISMTIGMCMRNLFAGQVLLRSFLERVLQSRDLRLALFQNFLQSHNLLFHADDGTFVGGDSGTGGQRNRQVWAGKGTE